MQTSPNIIQLVSEESRMVTPTFALLFFAAALAGPPGEKANCYITVGGRPDPTGSLEQSEDAFEYQVWLKNGIVMAVQTGGTALPETAEEALRGRTITSVAVVEL